MPIRTSCSLFLLLFISSFTWAQEDPEIQVDRMDVADSLYLNYYLYSESKGIEEALDFFLKEKNRSSETNAALEAKILGAQGMIAAEQRDYKKGIELAKKAQEWADQAGENKARLKGQLYLNQQQYWAYELEYDSVPRYSDLAVKYLKEALGPHHSSIAISLFEKGNAYGKRGKRRKEIQLKREAIANNIAFQGEFNKLAAIQEHQLANTFDHLGYYWMELECYKNVVRRWEGMPEEKDRSYLNIAYNSMSVWYSQHGDYKRAEQYILKAKQLVNDNKEDIDKHWFNETFKGRTQMGLWYYQASLAMIKKDTATAIDLTRKSLDFIENFDKEDPANNPQNLPYFYAFVRNYQVANLRRMAGLLKNKDPEEALRFTQKILTVTEEGDVTQFVLGDKLLLIDYHLNKSETDKALELIESWMDYARENRDSYSLIHFYEKLAGIQYKGEDYSALDESYQAAIHLMLRDTSQRIALDKIGFDDIKPYGSQSILDLLIKASDRFQTIPGDVGIVKAKEKGKNLSLLAADIFEEAFSHLPFNDRKYQTVTRLHEQLLRANLGADQEQLESGIERIIKNQSKTVWKRFLGSRQRKNLNIPDSVLKREDALRSELYFIKKQLYLNQIKDEEKLVNYKAQITTVESELEQLEEWYAEQYPAYFAQRSQSFGLKEVINSLEEGQGIIQYVLGDQHLYGFLLTNAGIQLRQLATKKQVEEKVEPLLEMLRNPVLGGYNQKAAEIYGLLFQDFLEDKSLNKLIVIPDGPLYFLPFEALVDAEGDYLVEHFEMSYTPSLLLWKEQRRAEPTDKKLIGVFAPKYYDKSVANPNRGSYGALMGASYEAETIADLFPSEAFIGEQANINMFKSKAQDFQVLHLAMHSTINNVDGEFSSLIFAPGEDGASELYVSELYNLTLNADLAVLSACNTGSGELVRGEGLVNASRAFTYAGVPSLVASLWEIPDKNTSEIMVNFYKALKDGLSKDEALRQAKLKYLQNTDNARLKHPFYWAGVVVMGDTTPVDLQGINYWWMVALFPVLLLAVFLYKSPNLRKAFSQAVRSFVSS